ncbi:MAG: LuxR C-terminal-related transcriptional regulator [Nitrospiraceae bacterium]|nr:LuxR C-terminal-related transcriptional regulator [Nitrospiraceae bacterium]
MLVNQLSLPEGQCTFVSVIYDSNEICLGSSPSLANDNGADRPPLIGSTLDEVCNPQVSVHVRAVLAQVRRARAPVFSIEIEDYFHPSLLLGSFTSLSVIPLNEGSQFVHVVQNVKPLQEALSGLSPTGSSLSGRERQILEYIARGLTSKQIASQLGISVFTVGNYRKQLLKKVGLHSAADLVAFWFSTYRLTAATSRAVAASTTT